MGADMPNENAIKYDKATRREFLARSAGVTAGLLSGLGLARHARGGSNELRVGPGRLGRPGPGGASNELRIGLVGCGGRGTGAVRDALATRGSVRLVAMGDVFQDRLQSSFKTLSAAEALVPAIDVPESRRFVGFDAYQRVLATDIDIVLLATPPAFRPLH